nr:ABC transporter substrate-binding protein [Micromonospora sp. DSM 115978]
TGKDLALGQQLFWEARNAGEKICGTYTVDLEVKDHGYNVQTATTQYSEMSGDILALNLLLGSPMATALSEQVIEDGIVAIPLSWAQSISDNPNYAIVGPTYDVEIINGLDYLLEEGLIAEGAKVGHIFHDSEYGENASVGVKYFAAEHGMTVVDQRVAPTEADLNSRVIALAAESVDVVVLTTTPPQTAAAAGATVAQGLAVPLVGSGPSYAPALVDTPARDVLLDRFYYAGPNAGLDAEVAAPALDLYRAQNPDGKPANSFATGYADGAVMAQFHEPPCAAGDL